MGSFGIAAFQSQISKSAEMNWLKNTSWEKKDLKLLGEMETALKWKTEHTEEREGSDEGDVVIYDVFANQADVSSTILVYRTSSV